MPSRKTARLVYAGAWLVIGFVAAFATRTPTNNDIAALICFAVVMVLVLGGDAAGCGSCHASEVDRAISDLWRGFAKKLEADIEELEADKARAIASSVSAEESLDGIKALIDTAFRRNRDVPWSRVLDIIALHKKERGEQS